MAETALDAADAARLAKQDLAVAKRINGDFYRRSAFHRGRIDRTVAGKRGFKTVDDLGKLPPIGLDDVSSTADLLSVGHPSRNRRYGAAVWAAHESDPLAYSARDLSQLAAHGAEVLERAGVRDGDVILDVSGTSTRDQLQLRGGASKAGFPFITVGNDSALVRRYDASVIAGGPHEVSALLQQIAQEENRVHTAIVNGDPLIEDVELDAAASTCGVTVIRMWAPPGVLAAWSQCRGGAGFHTFPESEVIEIVDAVSGLPVIDRNAGRLLWTGTRWYASAILRLQTEAFGMLDTTRCESCGRVSPRFVPTARRTSFCDVLDNDSEVTSWAAELHRTFKGDGLSIWVAVDGGASFTVLTAISERIGPARVHVVDASEVESIIEAANGERFGDRRAFVSDGS